MSSFPSTTNNNKNKKNYKVTRTTSHSGPGPTTHHPQLRTKSVPWCSSSPFYQTVENYSYLVIWVYIYYHKIIYKHVLLSRHRRSNSSGNHNSDNKNNNKMICEKPKKSLYCFKHLCSSYLAGIPPTVNMHENSK